MEVRQGGRSDYASSAARFLLSPENSGAPGGIRTPDTQFRSLVAQGVAACSPLFVNSRVWPEPTAFSSRLTTANSRESRRIVLFVVKLWSIGLGLAEPQVRWTRARGDREKRAPSARLTPLKYATTAGCSVLASRTPVPESSVFPAIASGVFDPAGRWAVQTIAATLLGATNVQIVRSPRDSRD